MRTSPRAFLGLLSLALLVGSCVGGDSPTAVGDGASVDVAVQPALIPTPADGDALPINRIRVSVSRVSDGFLLAQTSSSVSPTDSAWTLEVSVPERYSEETAYIFVRLLNVAADGTESVEFSGRSDAVQLVPGEAIEPDIPIVRGPVANLFTTGISITSAPTTMATGQSQALAADVTTSASTAPTIFWTSLDPEVVSMSGSTAIAIGGGTTQVVASAGAFADTVSIQVFPALSVTTASLPGGVQDLPYSQTLTATGGDGAYTWSVSAGSLPAGLTLDAGTGLVSGTPTVAGTASFTVQVASGDGQAATRALSIAVSGAPLFWANPTSGLWSVPGNWSAGRVPQAGDSVVINVAGTYTVTLDQDVQVAELAVGGGASAPTLDLGGFDLTVDGAMTVPSGGTVMAAQPSLLTAAISNAGTVDIGSEVSVLGSMTTSGTVTIRDGAQLTFVASPFVYDGGALDGPGTLRFLEVSTATFNADWTTGTLNVRVSTGQLQGSGVVTISPTSLFEVFGANVGVSLINEGTLDLSPATVTASLENRATLTARGTISGPLTTTASSDMSVQGVGFAMGTLTVTDGFTNNGTVTLTNGLNGQGSTLVVSNGPLVNGPTGLLVSATGVSGGTRTVTGSLTHRGALQVDYPLTVQGQLVVPAADDATIDGGGSALTVAGLDVDGLSVNNVPLASTGGTITRFDNVLLAVAPTATALTISHPGGPAPFVFDNVAFETTPTSGFYVSAADNAADLNTLTISFSNSIPADGSAATTTSGGAVVNWGVPPSGSLNNWTGLGDGTTWSDAGNWSAGVPAAGDSVVIDLAGTYTVTLDQNAQVAYLMLGAASGAQTLAFANAEVLTIDNAAVWGPNAVVDLANGTVDGLGTVTSTGSVEKSSGTGLATIDAFFQNNGSVDVQLGQLELADGTVHGGTFAIGSSALLRLPDVDTLGINGPITGPGVLELGGVDSQNLILTVTAAIDVGAIRVGEGAHFLNGSVAIADSLRIIDGSFRPSVPATAQIRYLFMDTRFGVLGGRLTVEVTDSMHVVAGVMSTQGVVRTLPGVPAVFPAGASFNAPRVATTLELQGPSVWLTGDIRVEGTGSFHILSGGSLDIQHPTTGRFEAITPISQFVRIASGGSMTKSGGGTTIVEMPLENEGTLDVQTGTFRLLDALTNSGTTEVATGATLDLDAPATHAAGALLRGSGIVDVDDMIGGELAGDVAPGSPTGTLTWVSDYTPSPSSRLLIELGGSTPGTHDVLDIVVQSDPVGTFAGTLVIDTVNGFVPAPGDMIPILTFDERVAPFAAVTFPTPSGVTLDTLWTNNVGLGARDTLYVVASGGPPATLVSWTGAGDGSSWGDGNNWSSGNAPGPGDSVVVTGAGTSDISLGQDVLVQSLTIGRGGGSHFIDAIGFNLRATANIVMDSSAVVFLGLGDTISSGGPISVVGDGTLRLTGGTVDASLVNRGLFWVQDTSTVTGALTTDTASVILIEGNPGVDAILTLAGGFTNNGLIEFPDSGDGNAALIVPGTLVNSVDGTISAPASGANASRVLFGVLDNRGAVEVAENFSLVASSGTHLNSGTIDVTAGSLLLNLVDASFTNEATGSVAVSSAADVSVTMPSGLPATSFTHAGSITIGANGQFVFGGAAGSFDIDGGTVDNSGTLSVFGGMDVTSSTDFTHAGGTLSLVVADWNGPGSLTVGPGAILQLGAAVIATDLENQGTVDLTSTASVQGQLIVPNSVNAFFTTPSTPYALTAAGVDVDGAIFSRVPLEINGTGTLLLDNVTFTNMDVTSTQLWVTHPGAGSPFTFNGLSFSATANAFIRADDSLDDANVLEITLSNSSPPDGSGPTTVTNGGAVVIWIT